MGSQFSSLLDYIPCAAATRDSRCLILGPTGVGKTTLLYRLKLNEYVKAAPTYNGFNVEDVKLSQRVNLLCWDISGSSDQLRRHLDMFFDDVELVIYLLDGTDLHHQLKVAKIELEILMSDEKLKRSAFAIAVNKADLVAQNVDFWDLPTVYEKLNLSTFEENRVWSLFSISAASGKNIDDLLRWIGNVLM